MRIEIDTQKRRIDVSNGVGNAGDNYTLITDFNILPLLNVDCTKLEVVIDNNLVVKYDNRKVESGELDVQGSEF